MRVTGRLQDKVALISGAGTGIGAATAARFAAEGAKVMLCGRREAPLRAVAEEIRSHGGDAAWIRADVTNEADVERVVIQTVAQFGGLHVMVNNAVNYTWGTLDEVSTESWRQCLSGSLDVAFFGTRAALRVMKAAGGGAIVNLGSVVGLLGSPGLSAYGAAKAGVLNFSRAVALEGAAHNVRVNVVIPGVVWSEGTREALVSEEIARGTARAVPLGRLGEPHEVAGAILFLASDEASYITGQSLVVDGGKTCRLDVGATDYVSQTSAERRAEPQAN
ncbi:2,5-dichloro-2,5-cyclohexadiene-1,4-diol dehydrogenase LinX (plasmid) [Cupriavidus necator N-1]|uniref:2,5-dichloro-2,5-cyclohexadiene-1,4-diol dehydrogenase LinX n=1 Tax=Cupriavidus necator (strain ATCC 43291 / DSM 13513 / CCUG 52238 / LMG 8453 / N-1) TaxID=1042878 RepID=F8GV22_CUPNN|nr:SDR family NAD(P)-dependent oxidoreductase [Cupriavidus necator]AEI81449.1 2,5-dichloro-2,5-cyclohexadiene-1,4-diol dehydrogenase LinX [Cupriavidus necator N-1]MDX6007823.1 SDR family NAD(P)-dependent oxidoreductase [Cupriavidus necator]